MSELMVQPAFCAGWTTVTIEGEDADAVLNILVARLIAADYEVLVEDTDGEMISWEDVDHG